MPLRASERSLTRARREWERSVRVMLCIVLYRGMGYEMGVARYKVGWGVCGGLNSSIRYAHGSNQTDETEITRASL